jgi:hypothetical protein
VAGMEMRDEGEKNYRKMVMVMTMVWKKLEGNGYG